MFVRVRFPFRVQILPTMKFLNCLKSWFKRTPKTFGCFDFDPSKIYSINCIRGVKILIPNDFKKAFSDNFGYDLNSITITLSGTTHTLTFGCSGDIQFTSTWTATEAL